MTLALVLFSAMTLGGCTTTKKTADATTPAPRTMVPESIKGSTLAKGGATASNRRIDPAAAKGAQQQVAAPAMAVAGPSAENAFPPAPETPPQTSIAGLATQPTGVRAGTGTIFSSAPPAPPVADPSARGPVPANLPRRNFNAMTASVYSAAQPAPPAACGTDAQGNAVSC